LRRNRCPARKVGTGVSKEIQGHSSRFPSSRKERSLYLQKLRAEPKRESAIRAFMAKHRSLPRWRLFGEAQCLAMFVEDDEILVSFGDYPPVPQRRSRDAHHHLDRS
jgi:hypothetical protein